MGYTLKNIVNSPFLGKNSSYVSSDYGPRTITLNGEKVSKKHNGIDLTSGTTIVPIAPGKVTAVKTDIKGTTKSSSTGNYVAINHGDNLVSYYYHMKYGSIPVKVGDEVSKDTVIGEKGATGNVTGPHLHLAIKKSGKWVDPKPYLLGEKAIGPTTYITIKVVAGDTLYYLANKFKTTIDELTKLNNKNNPNKLSIGETLKIPKGNYTIYNIKSGDNLYNLAKKYNTTWQSIYQRNKHAIGTNPNVLKVGIEIVI